MHAARIALTSPCAVGSFVAVTEFAPSPTMRPSRTMTAPNGPPLADTTFSVARAIARRRNSGFGTLDIKSRSSLSRRSKVKDSMAQAFRSTRVATNQGLTPATLVVQQGRFVAVREWGATAEIAELRDF